MFKKNRPRGRRARCKMEDISAAPRSIEKLLPLDWAAETARRPSRLESRQAAPRRCYGVCLIEGSGPPSVLPSLSLPSVIIPKRQNGAGSGGKGLSRPSRSDDKFLPGTVTAASADFGNYGVPVRFNTVKYIGLRFTIYQL